MGGDREHYALTYCGFLRTHGHRLPASVLVKNFHATDALRMPYLGTVVERTLQLCIVLSFRIPVGIRWLSEIVKLRLLTELWR